MNENIETKVVYKPITVADKIREGSIVWFKSSNNQVNCGIVLRFDLEKEDILVDNYDAWSVWNISFSDIIRLGIDFFGDEYQKWMSK